MYTASQAPNSAGRSRHGMPVRPRYSRASKNIRSGSTGGCPPVRRLAAATCGAIAAHRPSVSMYRMASGPVNTGESDVTHYPLPAANVNRA